MALTDNIVAYYKLDDGSGTTTTESVAANTGTWNGTLGSQWTTGKINGGGNFNGTDNYIVSTSNSGISGAGSFSLSCWFKVPTVNSAAKCLVAFGVAATTLGAGALFMCADNISTGSLSVEFAGANGYRSNTNVYSANVWNHFACTYSGGAINTSTQMYLNGTALSTATASTNTPNITNAPFYIGQFGVSGSFMSGQVDEVGLWSRALTNQEILNLYNNGTGLSYPFVKASSFNNNGLRPHPFSPGLAR